MKKAILTVIASTLLLSPAFAQTVKGKGIGSVTYEPVTQSTGKDKNAKKNAAQEVGASSRDKENALRKARLNAIETYFAERGEAENENYMRMEDKINDSLDRIILSDTILNEKDESGKYTVTISAEINEARLRTIMRTESAASSALKSQKSEIVYLFMGREVDSLLKSGPTVTASASSKAEVSAAAGRMLNSTSNTALERKEGERVTASQTTATVETREKSNAKVEAKVEAKKEDMIEVKAEKSSSSQTLIKRDQVSYKLMPMSNYDSAITSVFSQAGFGVIDPRFVIGEHLPFVNSDYERGDDIDASTLNGVAGKLRNEGVSYLVLATLDMDPPTIDSATGLNNVIVRAAVRVLDVSSRFPKEVASVPAYQIAGRGATDREAQNKALTESSQRAAREVVQRLNALDVR